MLTSLSRSLRALAAALMPRREVVEASRGQRRDSRVMKAMQEHWWIWFTELTSTRCHAAHNAKTHAHWRLKPETNTKRWIKHDHLFPTRTRAWLLMPKMKLAMMARSHMIGPCAFSWALGTRAADGYNCARCRVHSRRARRF